MRKFSIALIAIAAMVMFAAPAQSQWITNTLGFSDSLRSAATADTVWSNAINIEGCDYVAFNLMIDVTSAGGAGAGIVAVQGIPKGQYDYTVAAWQNLFVCDYGDSLKMVNTWAVSGTADVYKNFTVIPQPYGNAFQVTVNDAQYARVFITQPLPFNRIRIRIIDTNWTVHAVPKGNVILHKVRG